MKQTCPIHHFTYSGDHCPFCEKDRVSNMVVRHKKSIREAFAEEYSHTEPFKDEKPLDWEDLASKFSIKKL